jgi:hypothetical protein
MPWSDFQRFYDGRLVLAGWFQLIGLRQVDRTGESGRAHHFQVREGICFATEKGTFADRVRVSGASRKVPPAAAEPRGYRTKGLFRDELMSRTGH